MDERKEKIIQMIKKHKKIVIAVGAALVIFVFALAMLIPGSHKTPEAAKQASASVTAQSGKSKSKDDKAATKKSSDTTAKSKKNSDKAKDKKSVDKSEPKTEQKKEDKKEEAKTDSSTDKKAASGANTEKKSSVAQANKAVSSSTSTTTSSNTSSAGSSGSSLGANAGRSNTGSTSSNTSTATKPAEQPKPAETKPAEPEKKKKPIYGTKQEWVVDRPAGEREVEEEEDYRVSICNVCGKDVTGIEGEHAKAHTLNDEDLENSGHHGELRTRTKKVKKWFDEEGHWETVEDKNNIIGWE